MLTLFSGINLSLLNMDSLFICKLFIGSAFKTTKLEELNKIIDLYAQCLDQLGKQGKLILAGRTKIETKNEIKYLLLYVK